MKYVPIAIAAALLCGSAIAQAPDAAQRAENRAKAGELADKATPGPAQRAKNRAKAAEVADKATPDAAKRAENREKAGNVADKTVDGAKRAGSATKRGAERAAEVTGDVTRKAAAKVRNTGEAIARKLPPGPAERGMGDDRGGRTAMGAGPAVSTASADDRGDSSRRQRMDDAYGNWQRQGSR